MTDFVGSEVGETVTVDTPCVNCNYNLRSLPVSGRCPECETPIVRSGTGLSLHYADIGWLKGARLGAALFPWALILLMADSFALVWWIDKGTLRWAWEAAAMWLLWYFCWVCCTGGVLLLTVQEPRLRFVESFFCLRRCLRLYAIVVLAWASWFVAAYWYPQLRIRIPSEGTDALPEVAGFPLFILVGAYLCGFAHRLASPGLKRRTIAVIVGLGSVALVSMGVCALADSKGWDLSNCSVFGTLLLGVIGIAGIVYLIRYLLLLFEYKRQFGMAYTAASDLKMGCTEKTIQAIAH